MIRASCVDAEMSRQATAGRELAAPLAQVGKAQDRVDKVVAGGKLERIHTRCLERPAELGFPLFRRRDKALSKAAIMRVDEQLLAGLRILDDQKAQVRQLHFQWIVEADGDDIMAARKLCEGLRPTGRADEIGDDEDERAP